MTKFKITLREARWHTTSFEVEADSLEALEAEAEDSGGCWDGLSEEKPVWRQGDNVESIDQQVEIDGTRL